MELKEFTYLMTLAEEKNISRAAERLYMAQSSLSQFLQQFEEEVGAKLFVRTSRGIRLTYSGECFLEHIKRIQVEYQRAKNELWDNENLTAGKVLFGISSFRGQVKAPRILKRFQERYPNVAVELVEAHSMRLEELLLEGKLDLAVVVMPLLKFKSEVTPLKKDEILLTARQDHPVLAYLQPAGEDGVPWLALEDAARFELILSGPDPIMGSVSRDLLMKKKLKYQADNANISARMAVAMAEEGLGLAFTYRSCIEPSRNLSYMRIGKEGVYAQLGIAYPSDEYHSRAAQKLEEVVREVYREDDPDA